DGPRGGSFQPEQRSGGIGPDDGCDRTPRGGRRGERPYGPGARLGREDRTPMAQFLISLPYYVVSYAILIGLVITVHELGHFLAAKAVGTKIDRFSIGFGKAIFRRTDRAGVEWRIGVVPIGCYVRFAGDDNAASIPDQEDLD